MADSHTALLPFDAVLFDLDGVLTSTAKIHAACWKSMFDDFLRKHAESSRQPFTPFDIESDYKRYVDGKPRYEGRAQLPRVAEHRRYRTAAPPTIRSPRAFAASAIARMNWSSRRSPRARWKPTPDRSLSFASCAR